MFDTYCENEFHTELVVPLQQASDLAGPLNSQVTK